MPERVNATTLKAWLSDGAEIALIDVREHGQYGDGHPFFAVSLPYSRFELGLAGLVPNQAVRVVLCDGADGVEGWRAAGYTLYAGVNVPSKAFGELVEHARNTPRVTAAELQAMREAGED